ncbi:MAG: SusC/RagA family TonB-linked outer membrane protein, partial [Dysgonamonadaceae bacterium]|nr:SusC/RagA family TonB-linked outer membrane protein [Dysgonamonadaceae bacterium]
MKLISNLTLMALLLMAAIAMPVEAFAQQSRILTGIVVDENDEPVIGANVTVPGTSVGTATDLDGKFQLSAPAGKTTIQVAYLGYQIQTVSIANQTTITVRLVPENQGLDEVVVIGYGTVKKRDLTGAVSSVKADQIVQIPTGNALEAIQGKIPGMDITRNDGGAGSGVSILIRGTKTLGFTDQTGKITRTTEPLFIIDGVQGGSYADLNPNDIESIDVLKDASSTAIYGSLGANGVVIITTKRGKEANKVHIAYDGYYGVNGWVDYPKPRMGESYVQLRREAYRAAGQWSSLDDDYKIFQSEEWTAIQNNQWVDWIDELTRTGMHQSHNLSFTSGNDKVKTYVSLGYFNEQGIFQFDDMQRYTLRTNVDYNATKWLSAGINSQVTYYDKNSVPSTLLTNALIYTPLGTPYNEDGSINLFPVAGSQSSLSPMANQ